MAACTWRQPGTCQSVGTALYCRGLEEGHQPLGHDFVLCNFHPADSCWHDIPNAFKCGRTRADHGTPHQVEVLSPSNVHADVLRAWVHHVATLDLWCGEPPECPGISCRARHALRDAEAAAQRVQEGRY